jgi:hypothetical protein
MKRTIPTFDEFANESIINEKRKSYNELMNDLIDMDLTKWIDGLNYSYTDDKYLYLQFGKEDNMKNAIKSLTSSECGFRKKHIILGQHSNTNVNEFPFEIRMYLYY